MLKRHSDVMKIVRFIIHKENAALDMKKRADRLVAYHGETLYYLTVSRKIAGIPNQRYALEVPKSKRVLISSYKSEVQ